jgi:hypothetical protein
MVAGHCASSFGVFVPELIWKTFVENCGLSFMSGAASSN